MVVKETECCISQVLVYLRDEMEIQGCRSVLYLESNKIRNTIGDMTRLVAPRGSDFGSEKRKSESSRQQRP